MTSPNERAPDAKTVAMTPAPKTADNGNHDRLFRHAFSLPVVARQFWGKWLPPEMVAQTDWKTLRVSPVSGINEALAERREDIVYRVKVAGREMHFYILIEHQTKVARFMAQRFLEETVLVWQQDKRDRAGQKGKARAQEDCESGKLPLVAPILLHPGPGKWGKIRRLADLIDVPPRMEKWARTFMPDCGFIVVELAGLPFEKLADGHLARAILGALQGERLGVMDIRKISRLLDEFFADPDQAAVKAVAKQLWTYMLRCSEL
ncbi:MAG: Rpn family recombination-promoting nuclease/putative transposase, partial [Opitutaceae bacterium]|nr:Rpn family recombination-promoting nuclease/putative transposase [Opitutaceae bacterium]